MRNRNLLLTTALSSGLLVTSAFGQSAAPNSAAPPQTTESSAAVTDTKIDQFVVALAEVQRLQKQASDQQAKLNDPDAVKSLMADTQIRMAKAVEDAGLQVDEFNSLSQQLIRDTDFRTRVAEKMQRQGTP